MQKQGWLPAIDWYSFVFIQYNFAVTGVFAVFVKSPLIVKQVPAQKSS
jgi:hypothetical protein